MSTVSMSVGHHSSLLCLTFTNRVLYFRFLTRSTCVMLLNCHWFPGRMLGTNRIIVTACQSMSTFDMSFVEYSAVLIFLMQLVEHNTPVQAGRKETL